MSTFSFDFLPSPAGGNGVKVQPPSTKLAAIAIFALSILSSIYRYPLYALLTNAVAWVAVYVVCWWLSGGTSAKRKRKPLLLAACILAASICLRFKGPMAELEAALVPIIYLALRGLGLGKGDADARWRTAAVITIAGVVVLGTSVRGGEEMVLSGCAAVFTALAYVMLEENLEEEEGVKSYAQLGKDTAPFLIAGFAVAAVATENVLGEVMARQGRGWDALVVRASGGSFVVAARVILVGFLEAARWMIIPVLVSRYSVVGVAFLDLSAALTLVLFAGVTVVKAGAVAFAVGGMAWWSLMGPRTQMRMVHVTSLVLICLVLSILYATHSHRKTALHRVEPIPKPVISRGEHPIRKLIREAEGQYYSMRNNQSTTLQEAIQEYKRRYKMNPPPNFDWWYHFAKERNVVIIDEYDTIYHALKPFWGMPPKEIRKRARQAMGFKDNFQKDNKLLHAYIRNGEVEIDGQGDDWQKKATKGMMQNFVKWLPDMDLPFNIHDEPRVVVPSGTLQQYVRNADEEINKLDLSAVNNTFTPLQTDEKALPPNYPTTLFNSFAHQSIFTYSTLSCPADSPVGSVNSTAEDSSDNSKDKQSGQPLGFIVNTTESSDVCLSPSLEHRFGFFERPNAFNVVNRLYPIFSQSKVSSYGDIVYPSPWYWAHKVNYDEALDPSWEKKIQKLHWRGSTTGGFSRNSGWKHHHRQRMVSAIAATGTAKILRQTENRDWEVTDVPRESLSELFDIAFSHVGQCDPQDCDEQRAFFKIAPVEKQQDVWKWKYLLDMDGNAFSGRYHSFLKSKSIVFKLAVFREWHDEWLYPWVHYVPLGMGLEDIAEIMRFFKYETEGEISAKRIADESRSWANQVLRNEDLEVWLFRLLLEYGRVVDDNRDLIGFLG